MAQQQDGHLTTEQLSAFIDKQLSAQEQAEYEVHLQSCQQCQGLLDDLRQTVAMLHALPQPALPRSFVLPAEVLRPAAPALPAAAMRTSTPLAPGKRGVSLVGTRRAEQRAQERSRVRSYVLGRTLRVMSTLAAVIGFIFLVSAIPILHGGAATSSAGSTSGSSSSGSVPAASTQEKTPAMAPHSAGTKTTSPAQGQNGGPTPVITSQPTPTGTVPGNDSKHSPAASSPSPAAEILQTIGSILDPGTLGGRAIDGALLIALALLGFLLSKRWRKTGAT